MAFDSSQAYQVVATNYGQKYFVQSGLYYDSNSLALVASPTLSNPVTQNKHTGGSWDVWMASLLAGEDQTNQLIRTSRASTYRNITTATTTAAIKTGAGVLNAIVVNKAVATGVITIYDELSATGPVIATITFGAALLSDPGRTIDYGVAFSTGLTIVTSAAFDLTVAYI